MQGPSHIVQSHCVNLLRGKYGSPNGKSFSGWPRYGCTECTIFIIRNYTIKWRFEFYVSAMQISNHTSAVIVYDTSCATDKALHSAGVQTSATFCEASTTSTRCIRRSLHCNSALFGCKMSASYSAWRVGVRVKLKVQMLQSLAGCMNVQSKTWTPPASGSL